MLAPWADVLFAFDRKWWLAYGNTIAPGPELWTSNREVSKVFGLHYVRGEMGGGVAKSKDSVRLGGNSGFQALGLALLFGASEIVLLGYDMQLTNGRSHWHGDHTATYNGGNRLGNPEAKKMKQWHAAFEQIPDAVRARVINATRHTALNCFAQAPLHDVLKVNHET